MRDSYCVFQSQILATSFFASQVMARFVLKFLQAALHYGLGPQFPRDRVPGIQSVAKPCMRCIRFGCPARCCSTHAPDAALRSRSRWNNNGIGLASGSTSAWKQPWASIGRRSSQIVLGNRIGSGFRSSSHSSQLLMKFVFDRIAQATNWLR